MSEITLDTIYSPSKNAAYRKIGDDVVIVDTSNSRLLTLNKTGTTIWMALGGKTGNEIVSTIEETFEVNHDKAADDVQAFLTELDRRGLITAQS